MTDDFWSKDTNEEMQRAALRLLESMANSLKSIDSKLDPVIVEKEPEDKPRFLGER